MVSLNVMIQKISGLHDTPDLSDWENNFVADVVEKTQEGKVLTMLSPKQISSIEKIHDKHFA